MNWAIKHNGLIRSIARNTHRRAVAAGASIELDDLVQDGAVVAIRAQSKYDQSKGAESTYLHTSLQRSLNNKVDIAIYHRTDELTDVTLIELKQGQPADLLLWDFARGLSKPAQALLATWMAPGTELQREIQSRTIGRRCSFKALLHYLQEQGHDGDRLNALYREITTKAELHEG